MCCEMSCPIYLSICPLCLILLLFFTIFWNDNIIPSAAEGVQQGDPLVPLFFCLTLHEVCCLMKYELCTAFITYRWVEFQQIKSEVVGTDPITVGILQSMS